MPTRKLESIVELLRHTVADETVDISDELLRQYHPADVVRALKKLDERERRELTEPMPTGLRAWLLPFTPRRLVDELLAGLEDPGIAEVLDKMPADDAVDLLESMSRRRRKAILKHAGPRLRATLDSLLESVPESAGAIMTTEFLTLDGRLSVAEAVDTIERVAADVETPYAAYVITEEDHLRGVISLRELLSAPGDDTVEELMRTEPVVAHVDEDQEEVAGKIERYDVLALPVVDDMGRLVGVVTHDDVLDVAAEEATEDFQKAAAIAPLKRAYHDSAVFHLFQKRIGWLLLLILVNLVSSGIIEAYEATLEQIIALAFFIPLLIDSGGNTGTQSATVMVRALATGEVKMRQWFKALGKELFVGLTLGVVMGLGSALLGFYRGDWALAVVVGLSMGVIVVTANLIGTLLPFVLTKFNIDPAVASSPLITSIADAAGLFIYFGIATAFLQAGMIG